MDGEDIKRRFSVLESSRRSVEQQWHDIEQYVTPYRGEFYKDNAEENSVSWDQSQIFDSTAINAAQKLAASLSGDLTSAAYMWFGLRFRADELNRNHIAQKWLQDSAKMCYESLQDSDFNMESGETYLDLTSYGTSIIVEEEELDRDGNHAGLDFSSVPIRECFFEEDHKKRVLRFYRRRMMTPGQMITKFGSDKVPAWVVERAESPEYSNVKEKVIFAIYLRKLDKDVDLSKPLAPKARPYGSKYILHKDAEMLGEEAGYYEMPAFVPRWRKTNDSVWGNSPAMMAIYDIKTLNEQEELMLMALAKVVDPPYLTTERGLIGDLDLEPGGLNVTRSIDDLRPLPNGTNFNVAMAEREEKRKAIKQAFMIDQLELRESSRMTTVEVNIRYQQMLKQIGPTLGRIQNDFLDPMIQRTFNILLRAGRLPEIPDVVKQHGGEMDIEYRGPMSRAMQMDNVQNIQAWVGQLAGLSEIKPEMLDYVDFDELPQMTATMMTVPMGLVRSKEVVDAERAERAKAQQAQQQMMMAQQAGDAMQSMGAGAQALQGETGDQIPQQ